MATIRISQLNELSTVTGDDFFPISDSGSLTTYRTSLTTIGDFISASVPVGNATSSISASYALSASHAQSASYAPTAAIGTVAIADSASWASASLQSHFATQSLYATQSRFATQSLYATQSLFATQSLYTTSSLTASYLSGSGVVTTMIASSSVTLAQDAWIELGRVPAGTVSNLRQNSIFFNKDVSPTPSNDFIRLYYREDIMDVGSLVFEHGDNVDAVEEMGQNLDEIRRTKPGYVFASIDLSATTSASLLHLGTNGRLTGRTFSARCFTSSLAHSESIGFYGTASWSEEAKSASYVGGASIPGMPKAWATVIIPTASNYSTNTAADQVTGNSLNKPIIFSGYNVSDISWAKRDIDPAVSFNVITDAVTSVSRRFPYPHTQSYNGSTNVGNFIVTMTNALSNVTYSAFGAGGEQANEVFTVMTYPWARRTITKFTASVRGTGDWSGYPENVWFQFVVY